jgi:2-oxoglutarate dehydrogenase complex dehydrogenase (E1) component-like enzyme
MNKQLQDSVLFGTNASFVEAIYEEYLHNPISIDPLWREYFDRLHQSVNQESVRRKDCGVFQERRWQQKRGQSDCIA